MSGLFSLAIFMSVFSLLLWSFFWAYVMMSMITMTSVKKTQSEIATIEEAESPLLLFFSSLDSDDKAKEGWEDDNNEDFKFSHIA